VFRNVSMQPNVSLLACILKTYPNRDIIECDNKKFQVCFISRIQKLKTGTGTVTVLGTGLS
jgi:hypothetical protein